MRVRERSLRPRKKDVDVDVDVGCTGCGEGCGGCGCDVVDVGELEELEELEELDWREVLSIGDQYRSGMAMGPLCLIVQGRRLGIRCCVVVVVVVVLGSVGERDGGRARIDGILAVLVNRGWYDCPVDDLFVCVQWLQGVCQGVVNYELCRHSLMVHVQSRKGRARATLRGARRVTSICFKSAEYSSCQVQRRYMYLSTYRRSGVASVLSVTQTTASSTLNGLLDSMNGE